MSVLHSVAVHTLSRTKLLFRLMRRKRIAVLHSLYCYSWPLHGIGPINRMPQAEASQKSRLGAFDVDRKWASSWYDDAFQYGAVGILMYAKQ